MCSKICEIKTGKNIFNKPECFSEILVLVLMLVLMFLLVLVPVLVLVLLLMLVLVLVLGPNILTRD